MKIFLFLIVILSFNRILHSFSTTLSLQQFLYRFPIIHVCFVQIQNIDKTRLLSFPKRKHKTINFRLESGLPPFTPSHGFIVHPFLRSRVKHALVPYNKLHCRPVCHGGLRLRTVLRKKKNNKRGWGWRSCGRSRVYLGSSPQWATVILQSLRP